MGILGPVATIPHARQMPGAAPQGRIPLSVADQTGLPEKLEWAAEKMLKSSPVRRNGMQRDVAPVGYYH
jgi:hypothetical protein